MREIPQTRPLELTKMVYLNALSQSQLNQWKLMRRQRRLRKMSKRESNLQMMRKIKLLRNLLQKESLLKSRLKPKKLRNLLNKYSKTWTLRLHRLSHLNKVCSLKAKKRNRLSISMDSVARRLRIIQPDLKTNLTRLNTLISLLHLAKLKLMKTFKLISSDKRV